MAHDELHHELHRPACRRGLVVAAVAALLTALCPLPAAADTLLVATRETVDGVPCGRPLPLGEGLSAALFAAGHIVFGQDEAATGAAPLLSLAVAGGADLVLEAEVDWHQKAGGTGPATLSGRVRWTLWAAAAGTAAGTGTVDAGNAGREGTVDLATLGAEAGAALARAVAPLLGRGE
jgi:hypothetical protein